MRIAERGTGTRRVGYEARPTGAGNTNRPLTHSSDLSREGLAVNATHQGPWLPILGYVGVYDVDAQGRIRNARTGHILKPFNGDARGHLKVSLSKSGHVIDEYVHRIVASTHLRMPRPGEECRHLDGNPSNNAVQNLAWGTRSENVRDSIAHGTYRNANAAKTHCRRGHEYTPGNTYRPHGTGSRRCRACKKASK